MTIAIVPVKDPTGAKERLSSLLSPDERRSLALAMLEDVLRAVCAAKGLEGVAVVTSHPEVAAIAQGHGAEVILEPQNRGESAAVEFAARTCMERGCRSVIVLPGDIPLVRSDDVEAVLAQKAESPEVFIVPSADETGSNALLLSPPDVIPLHFGPDSFRLHQMEARARGVSCRIQRMGRIALDIDTPDDLAALLSQPGGGRAQALLQGMGIPARIQDPSTSRRLP